MAPNISNTQPVIRKKKDFQKKETLIVDKMTDEEDGVQDESKICTKTEGWFDFKMELKWLNVISIILFHVAVLYGSFTFIYFENLKTSIWTLLVGTTNAIGVTAGAHRLWCHRAYMAKWPLRVILLIFYCSAGQNNLYDWVRDHRVHHKYTDTDADPHNSNRGFFFSHVGWLMMKKHPEVIKMGRQVDMSDILADPVAAFGCKYFSILKFVFSFLLPIIVPVYAWNETWSRAFISQYLLRYAFILNATWSVNSAAHIWGSKPYDANINPAENRFVALLTYGEGWHNYHHVFPWDYKAAELGNYKLNMTTMFIDFFAKIGWAYDLKQPSEELVKTVTTKRGDGSHPMWNAMSYSDSKIK